MMEFVHVAVVVLSLLSAGQSAPLTNCEGLTKTLEIQGRDQLLGRWTHIGESTDIPGTGMMTKVLIDTATLINVAGDNNQTIRTTQTHKTLGRCFSLSYTQTLQHNTVSIEQPYPGSASLLNTSCPDCLVVYSNYTIGQSTYKGLLLLSRRPKVSPAELAEFAMQIKCLRLPRPFILDPEKGFCSEETVTTDLTDGINNMGTEEMSELEKLLKSPSGRKELMEMVTKVVAELDSA